MSTLYVVATPIGNLEDITLRALRILKEVNLILCEDTRVTRKLLNHHKIASPVLCYHEHSSFAKTEAILERLKAGENLALVTDAGTPSISDPGRTLMQTVRERLKESVQIVAIPGPSALTAALSICGLPTAAFTFLGFLPHKKGRATAFRDIAESKRTSVFYESPHRLLRTLEVLSETLTPNSRVAVVRELTKIYEEYREATTSELLNFYKSNPDRVRGECVIIVSPFG